MPIVSQSAIPDRMHTASYENPLPCNFDMHHIFHCPSFIFAFAHLTSLFWCTTGSAAANMGGILLSHCHCCAHMDTLGPAALSGASEHRPLSLLPKLKASLVCTLGVFGR